MPGSPPSVLRLSFWLFLTVSSFGLLNSRVTPQDHDEDFLDSYQQHLFSNPLGANGGPGEDFPFGSRDGHTFPQKVESAFIMENEAQTTQVWPQVILDYMRHQLKFRGRTKKSTKKGCTT